MVAGRRGQGSPAARGDTTVKQVFLTAACGGLALEQRKNVGRKELQRGASCYRLTTTAIPGTAPPPGAAGVEEVEELGMKELS